MKTFKAGHVLLINNKFRCCFCEKLGEVNNVDDTIKDLKTKNFKVCFACHSCSNDYKTECKQS